MGFTEKWKQARELIHQREAGKAKAQQKDYTREEIRALRRDIERRDRRTAGSGMAGKAIRSIGHGINDIAQSLNTPYTNKRPGIAQLPQRRPDISQNVNLEALKPPGMRGKTLKGGS